MKHHLLSLIVLIALVLIGIAPLAAQDTTDCEEGFRLFDHELLATDPVCVPENPQRILALEIAALETVLFTDKELVGTANWLHSEIPVLLPELAPALEGIADTGYPANLEVALSVNPDLILATDGDIDPEAGAAIAPLVIVKPDYDWKLMMEFWSDVLGTQEVYADMLANYEARIAEFQEALTDNPEISIIGASSYGAYMWLEDTAPGFVLMDAGLARPESQALSGQAALDRYDAERWIQLSEERYDLADADHIFVFSYATTDPETLETENNWMTEFRANPIWNSLSASQAGNVHYVGPYWWRAQTYLLANYVLDDLFNYVAGVDPADVSPNPFVADEVEATACEDGFRSFNGDVRGEPICVPDVPQRIVATHDSNAGLQVLSLGGPLVGLATRGGEGEFSPNITQFFNLSDITDIGEYYTPNIERVLELEPDLIVHEGFNGDQWFYDGGDTTLEALEAIAPVVIIDTFRSVEEVMTDYQELLGDAATIQLEEQRAEFEMLLEEIELALDGNGEDFTVGYLHPHAQGFLQALGPTAVAPTNILTRVGVNWVPIQLEAEEEGGYLGDISYERIDRFSGDIIMINAINVPEIVDNPLIQGFPAIEAGQIVVLEEPFAGTHYPSYIAVAETILEQLQAIEDLDPALVFTEEASD